MDAVHNRIAIPKIAFLLLTAALLVAAPWQALAQPAFSLSSNSVSLSGATGGAITVSSTGSPITYTAVVTYPAGTTAWLSVNNSNPIANSGSAGSFTTQNSLAFSLGQSPPCNNCTSVTATVTLTASSPTGVSSVQIPVSWAQGGGGGGGGGGGSTGAIFASSGTVYADTSSGTTSQQQITLNTTSTSGVSFSLASTNPAGWLSVSPGSGTVYAGSPFTLYFNFNASNLAAGNSYTTVTVNYGSSQTINIAVTFDVIGSTALTISPNTASWSYSAGGQVPSSSLTITSGTQNFNAKVDPVAYPWIILFPGGQGANYPASTSLYGIPTSLGLVVEYNTAATAPAAGTVGTVTISDTASPPNSATFSVTFNGGGGSSGTVTISPFPLNLSSPLNSGTQAQATVQVTSTVSGNVSVGFSSLTCNNGCLTASLPSNTTIAANGTVNVVIYGNPSGLAAATYSGLFTATVTSNGTTSQASIQVGYIVGGGGGATSAVVAPTSLTFSADAGNATAVSAQYVTIADTGNFTASVTNGSSWLSVGATSGNSGGASSPALLEIIANPAGLGAGTYTGTVAINSTSGATTVAVNLQVYNGAVMYAVTSLGSSYPGNAGSMNVTAYAGNISGQVPTLSIYSSETASMSISGTTATTWLQQVNQVSTSGNNSQFQILFNPTNLPNGLYNGALTFKSSTAANSPLTVPVVMSVTGSSTSSGLTLTQSSVAMNGIVNGAQSTAQLGVTASTITSFSASATVSNSSVQWLTVTPSTGTASSTNTYLTVTANPTTLTAGTYYGTITVAGGGTQATAAVTFVVSNSGGSGGNVTSTPSSLTFNYQANGTLPSNQSLYITNVQSYTQGIPFTISTAVSGNSANWLTATSTTGSSSSTTPGTVVVSVSPGTLPAGSYTGTVLISPTGGSLLSVGVTFTIQGAPMVSASPSTLTYSYQLGGTTPASQPVQVNGSATGLPYSVQVSTASGTGWLSVNKTSGTTPDVLSVSVNPTNLNAGTSYNGTIVVTGTGAAGGSTSIAVVLAVTAPFPSISSVVNGGSLLSGPISPGEIVTIKGTALGPVSPLQTTIDPTSGKVATQLGSVQVLFNGYPSPLTYVSATQINCVVPYELAQLSSPYVQVRYLGQSSNTFNLTQAATAPAIFTASGTGTGQGAVLNSDYSFNGTSIGFKPAPAGSVIQVYMTGEGQTSPQGVTGKVNCPSGTSCTVSQLPVPLLPVGALVNNQPATITFYGEAPGFVSGVMQVDLIIPPNTPSGPATLLITVGSTASQANVIIAVQ